MIRVPARVLAVLLAAPFCLSPLAAGVGAAGRTPVAFDSVWRSDRPIRVDGSDGDWRGLTAPVKGEHFSVGFANDADALYVCLETTDRVLATQITQQGLILWFERAGDKSRYGLRYPVPGTRIVPGPGLGDTSEPGGSQQVVPQPPDSGQGQVEVLGPGKRDTRQVTMDEGLGIEARVGIHGKLLVCELRLPLRPQAGSAFALDADANSRLRVELQTGEWRGPLPLGHGPFGIGIGVGVAGPGGGIAYPGAQTAVLRPLDVVGELRLATPE
jgi:hypothetical protein